MKNSDWFWCSAILGFHVGLIKQGHDGIFTSCIILLITSFICLFSIVANGVKTTEVWKPLFISFTGLIIGITLLIINFNKWVDKE